MAKAKYYYYNSTKKRWIVSKGGVYFGSYKNEDTAKIIVEEMKKVDWDKNQLWKIRNKLGLGLC